MEAHDMLQAAHDTVELQMLLETVAVAVAAGECFVFLEEARWRLQPL